MHRGHSSDSPRSLSQLGTRSVGDLQRAKPQRWSLSQKCNRRLLRVFPGPNGAAMIYHSVQETSVMPCGEFPTSQQLPHPRHAANIASFDEETRNYDLPMSQPTARRCSILPPECGEILETRKRIPEGFRSRRYATDFGLGRYDDGRPPSLPSPPSLPPPCLSRSSFAHRDNSSVSSIGSMPLTQDPETDSSSSFYEDFSREFPQPPPISPVLRRMKSSPWLTDQRTSAVKKHSVQQRRNMLNSSDQHTSEPSFSPSISCRAGAKHTFVVDCKKEEQFWNPDCRDLDLEMVGEALIGLDMNSPTLESSIQGISAEVGNSAVVTVISGGSELLRWSTSHRGTPPPATQTSIAAVHQTVTNSHYHNAQVSGNSREPQSRLPHIIRKVASMREDAKDGEPTSIVTHRSLPKIKSLRFTPPRWDLLHKPDTDKEPSSGTACARLLPGAKQRETINGAEAEWSFPRTPCPSSTANGVPQKLSHRQHQSVPLTGLGFSNAALLGSQAPRLQPLATPFSHRPSRSAATQEHKGTVLQIPKSFIDITPEQVTAPVAVRKERVRRFIAKASNGVVNWSRQFGRKTHSSG